jgi:2-oxoglutarate ferredoxin oxidoreductase subunit gamma
MSTESLYEQIVVAGFGGQGIILAGRLLAQTAMQADLEVTYMPSYGAEVRGGTAHCKVIFSHRPIACPVFSEADSLLVMNKASQSKFGPHVQRGGLLLYNSSLIHTAPVSDNNVEIVAVPADEIAVELGSPRSANMVMLGAYLQKRGILSTAQATAALPEVLAERYHKTIPVNTQALRRGAELVACPA